MIFTITLNPALDVSGTVEELVPDEKSYVSEEVHTPGGNGINAAIIAHRLGAKVCATGFLGGPNGEEIRHLLKEWKVPEDFLSISGRTRMNLTVSNTKTHRQTRLSFPGPKIKKAEWKKFQQKLEQLPAEDLIVIGGSLPPGIKGTDVASLVRKLKKKGHRVMVDVPGKILKDVVAARPDFIKPNLVEFQELVGKRVTSMKEILPLVKKFNRQVPLICVSSVEGGAILVSAQEAWYGRIPKVKIRSTVGAGDSMVGAIAHLWAYENNCSVKNLLRKGLAAASATLTEKGMTLGSKKSILHYEPLIYLKELK